MFVLFRRKKERLHGAWKELHSHLAVVRMLRKTGEWNVRLADGRIYSGLPDTSLIRLSLKLIIFTLESEISFNL